MKRMVVTGGVGFIGLHLIAELLKDPEVIQIDVIDDLSGSALSVQEAENFWSDKRVRIHCLSVADARSVLHELDFEYIFHLAAAVGPVGILSKSGRILPRAVSDCASLAALCITRNARLMYTSSSEVYGGGVNGECREDGVCKISTARVSARLEYALSKLSLEVYLRNLVVSEGLNCVIVRPFNVAGPLQSAIGGFVIPRFIGQALCLKPLTVYGNGEQRRSFTHVQDVVSGMIHLSKSAPSGSNFNLGNPKNTTSILKLAKLVCSRFTYDCEIQFVDPTTLHGASFAEASEKYPSSDSALTWTDSRSLDGIIDDTIAVMSSCDDNLFERLFASGEIRRNKLLVTCS